MGAREGKAFNLNYNFGGRAHLDGGVLPLAKAHGSCRGSAHDRCPFQRVASWTSTDGGRRRESAP